MSDYISEHGRALEDAFFRERDRELLAKLKEQASSGQPASEIASALGIDDLPVAAKLLEVGMRQETALAISMVPLVQVAWADGAIQPAEREAIESAADQSGIRDGSPARRTLDTWLAEKPSDELASAWRSYIQALVTLLSQSERERFKEATMHRAKSIAVVAGGVLGIGSKFTDSEKRVLDDLRKAFD